MRTLNLNNIPYHLTPCVHTTNVTKYNLNMFNKPQERKHVYLFLYYHITHAWGYTNICSTTQQHDSLIENIAFNYNVSVCHDNNLELLNNRCLILTHYKIIHDFIKALVLLICVHNY